MTVRKQINILLKVGCESAIREIRQNHGRPLSNCRIRHYLDISMQKGFVLHAEALAKVRGYPLTSSELTRIINRCLRLGWVIDALSAARLGPIPKQIQRKLIRALVASRLADDAQEAAQLVSETD